VNTDATFRNEPLLEFRRESVRAQALRALAELRAKLPLRIGEVRNAPDTRISDVGNGAAELISTNPADPTEVVAVAPAASSADANNAVATAAAAFTEWSSRSGDERAAVLQRAAGFMRERRLELAALAVLEAGKPWPEADADVCEAVDFLEYYAAGVLALEQGRPLVQLPGERNTLRYFPRGVCAVIAPWNFPLAIPTGMIAAALGTGNTVVFKPAEQTPACAHAIVEALHAAGVPAAALQLLCGGDEPAKALVAHARVHTIAFTGSVAAGLSIIRAAAEPAAGQRHIKRVIAEMGGKNCIIVDADADLDDAVPAIVKSAFGFAGQKCSAASRVLVHRDIADELNTRLAGAVETLRVGPAEDFSSDLSVVIDEEALARIGSYLDGAQLPPRATATIPEGGGHYVKPTLFVDLPSDSRIVNEEVFGPVLSSERVDSIEHALEIVEAGPYGLTGGLFSRSPRTIDLVSRRGIVGNLYVNREITGAMVGRQPFGGGRLSGTGPKAGGPDYLLQFVEARSVSENTVRHGLVV
jgi:RHH-type proline utilization regulon transcriptional repressor/proline dehydrogenase/delta 1-pyrroline-5-carboxylate dehydrogenase